MWYHEHLKIGHRVYRAENPCHQGRVSAIFAAGGVKQAELLRLATFRVDWDNGWREDLPFEELRRDFTPTLVDPHQMEAFRRANQEASTRTDATERMLRAAAVTFIKLEKGDRR